MNDIHRIQASSIDLHVSKVEVTLAKSSSGDSANYLSQIGTTNLEPYGESDKKQVDLALQQLNSTLRTTGTEIRLKYNDEAEQIIVELLDQASREVIATSPAEYLIELSIRMKEMVGVFLDQKV